MERSPEPAQGPDAAAVRAARVLAERARALAAPPPPEAAADVPALAFDAGGERFAIPLAGVLRVERVAAVARVPGAPRGHLGLFNLHGRPCPLVDVPALLGVPGAAPAARRWALVLGRRGPELALGADAVEIEHVAPERLQGGVAPRLGLTADARVVLDPAALLALPGEAAR